jgi:hypothetical protein
MRHFSRGEREVKQERPSSGAQPDTFEALRAALAHRIARWTDGVEQVATAVPGLTLYRHDEPTEPMNCMVGPSIALTVQGAKRALLGEHAYSYHSGRFLLAALNLPVVLQAVEAHPDRPYLSLVLTLDARSIAELVMQAEPPALEGQANLMPGLVLGETTEKLLELFLRLVDLLDDPAAVPVLGSTGTDSSFRVGRVTATVRRMPFPAAPSGSSWQVHFFRGASWCRLPPGARGAGAQVRRQMARTRGGRSFSICWPAVSRRA